MLSEEELRYEVSPGLRGRRRVHEIERKGDTTERRKGRARYKRWAAKPENAQHHRDYNSEYQKQHREINNAAVERFKKKNPERRKAQLRAAARRYQRKKALERQQRGENQ